MNKKKEVKNYLYYSFNTDTEAKELSLKEKKQLNDGIKKLNTSAKEAFFSLICEHAYVTKDFNTTNTELKVPYGGTFDQNSVEFDFESIPIPLQRILYKFTMNCINIS